MATGTHVPFTTPGQPACCCGGLCETQLIDFLFSTGGWDSNYQRIFLSETEYEDVRNNGLLITNSTTLTGSSYWGGPIVSTTPTLPIVFTNTMSFPNTNLNGVAPSPKCWGTVNNLAQAIAVQTFNEAGMQSTVGVFGPVIQVALQAIGEGRTGVDKPLAQRALYIQGVCSRSSYPNINAYGSWRITDSGASIGTILGQTLKGFYDTNYATTGILTTTTIEIAP